MRINGKNVVGIRFNMMEVPRIILNGHNVFESVHSCFGSGMWIGNKPWIGKEKWKGTK